MPKDFMTSTDLEKMEGREGSTWADIMFKISQRCQTGEDRQRAMHHGMEIMDTTNWFSINSREIQKLLSLDGVLSTFEVSVNEDLYDNGAGILITEIMNKIDSYGVISGVMINFFVDYQPEAPNHPSSSYEEDQTGFGDKYDIFVSDMYWVDENYEDHDLNIDTSGIEDALMNMVEVEYTGTDDDRAAYWE